MFEKKRIAICTVLPSGMSATLFGVTRKGVMLEKRVEPVTFGLLKTQYHIPRVRILLSENDTYLKLLQFPKGIVVTRELIAAHIQEMIPEWVEDGYMDWKKVYAGGEGDSVQVFVVKKSVLEPILKAATAAGIVVEACEPPSLAMARLTKHIKESFLLVYPLVKPLYLAAVSGGRVLEVSSVDPINSLEKAKRTFVEYVAKLWGVTLTAIATDMPSPIVGLAAKTDFNGEDMEVLTIPSGQSAKPGRSFPMPLLIGIIAFVVMVSTFFLVRFIQRNTHTSDTPIPVTAISPTPEPTKKSVSKTDIQVEVQNGSGEAGLAAKGKTALETLGFTRVTAGNADNYEYEGVLVKGKTVGIADFVASDIKATYAHATVSSMLIDKEATQDAIVILGKDAAL